MMELKRIVHPKRNFTYFLLNTMSMEALVTFSNPHTLSGVSQRGRIASSAHPMEAHPMVSAKCLEDAAVQVIGEENGEGDTMFSRHTLT